MITKKSVVEIQNLVVNLKSLPVKLNPDYQSKGTMLKTTKWLHDQIILPRLIKKIQGNPVDLVVQSELFPQDRLTLLV